MVRTASSEDDTVPSHGDPDRKRVLNVLAQRRYRQRRRQRLAELEAQAKAVASPSSTSSNNGVSSSDQEGASPQIAGGVSIIQDASDLGILNTQLLPEADPFNTPFEELPNTFDDVPFMDSSLSWTEAAPVSMHGCIPPIVMPMYSASDTPGAIAHTQRPQATARVDPFSIMQNPDVPMMKMMSISLHVANLLGCMNSLWDDKFLWTVDPLLTATLPSAFQPTPAQLSIPHHPLFDLIPFPATRSKLICVFAMPSEMRPPNAKGDMAIMGVVHDIEHDTEGLRASGGDGYREEDWEVGEAFAKHWWWALDRETIRRSNEMRLQRGARRLLESA